MANDGLYTLIVENEFGIASKTIEAQLHGGIWKSFAEHDASLDLLMMHSGHPHAAQTARQRSSRTRTRTPAGPERQTSERGRGPVRRDDGTVGTGKESIGLSAGRRRRTQNQAARDRLRSQSIVILRPVHLSQTAL